MLWQHRPMPPRRTACRLPASHVQTKDVPGDGNCLFHAMGLEIRHVLPTARLPAEAGDDRPGAAWRAAMLRHVEHSQARSMDGHTPTEWLRQLGQSLDGYLRRMRVPLSRRSWGGQVEAAFVADMLRDHALRVTILTQDPATSAFVPFAAVGSAQPAASIYVVWTGQHYLRARLIRQAQAAVSAWCQAA